jgi:hypothetical protein
VPIGFNLPILSLSPTGLQNPSEKVFGGPAGDRREVRPDLEALALGPVAGGAGLPEDLFPIRAVSGRRPDFPHISS